MLLCLQTFAAAAAAGNTESAQSAGGIKPVFTRRTGTTERPFPLMERNKSDAPDGPPANVPDRKTENLPLQMLLARRVVAK